MIKDKLILVPHFRFDESMGEKEESIIANTPKEELDNNPWWALYGKLDKEAGCDWGVFINCKSAGYSRETVDYTDVEGIYVTKVKDENNPLIHRLYVDEEIPVKVFGFPNRPAIFVGYIVENPTLIYKGIKYPNWEQRGFIVFADDELALEQAREYRNRYK